MSIDHTGRWRATRRSDDCVDLALAAGYLPSFENIVAVTTNASCVLTTTGHYAGVCFSRPADRGRRGLWLCFPHPEIVEATIAPAIHHAGLPPSLVFRTIDQDIQHRTYLTSAADELALDCLRSSLSSFDFPGGYQGGSATIRRLTRTPPTDRNIDRQVVPYLLNYLAELRLPMTMTVENPCCSHSIFGALDDISRTSDLLVARSESSTLSFDPASIRSWHVRGDGAESRKRLEARGHDAQAILALETGDNATVHSCECWHNILDSLPMGPSNR